MSRGSSILISKLTSPPNLFLRSLQSLPQTDSIVSWLVGWLEINGTFSTKRLYRAMQKLKFVSFISLGS